jgi:hypothetical protein
MKMEEIITLHRSTGPKELELVAVNGYLRWPPRLTWNEIKIL